METNGKHKSPIIDLIEQQEKIDEKAWKAFNQEYDLKTPSPSQKRSWYTYAINTGAIAALVVSGAFTIPVFSSIAYSMGMNQLVSVFVGIAGFFMVNGSLFAATHQWIDGVYRPQALSGKLTQKTVIAYLTVLIIFDVLIDIASNLYYIMFGFNVLVDGSQADLGFSIGLGILMSIAPSLVAIAGGAILALMPLKNIIEQQAYEKARNAAWTRYKRKRGLNLDMESLTEKYVQQRLGLVETPVSQAFMNVHEHYETPSRRTKTRQSVHDHLNSNPSDFNLSVRDLADKLNLSTGLVSEETRNWERENQI